MPTGSKDYFDKHKSFKSDVTRVSWSDWLADYYGMAAKPKGVKAKSTVPKGPKRNVPEISTELAHFYQSGDFDGPPPPDILKKTGLDADKLHFECWAPHEYIEECWYDPKRMWMKVRFVKTGVRCGNMAIYQRVPPSVWKYFYDLNELVGHIGHEQWGRMRDPPIYRYYNTSDHPSRQTPFSEYSTWGTQTPEGDSLL